MENLAQSDWQFSKIWSIYAKNSHFVCKGQLWPNTASMQVLVKQEVAIIERHKTHFEKKRDEANEQNQILGG